MKTSKPKKELSETSSGVEAQTLTPGLSIYDVPDAILTARELAYELAGLSMEGAAVKKVEEIIAVLSKCVRAIGRDDIGKVVA